MIWTRNGFEKTQPPSRREVDVLTAEVADLSDTVNVLSDQNYDLQNQLNELLGRLDTLESALGWMEVKLP